MGYIPFTETQKNQAVQTDLVDFLEKQGIRLKRTGREYKWKADGGFSVSVCGNKWYDQYDREGGGPISFVRKYFDKGSYAEAVSFLLGMSCGTVAFQERLNRSKEQKPFQLPPASQDTQKIYAYLMQERCIDQEVISFFIRQKLLYEDRVYHNAVFVGLDAQGRARHAHKRGPNFMGNVAGSLPQHSFHYIGTSDTIYSFEAPIDLLAYITLHKESDWAAHSYVAECCASDQSLLYQLQQHPHLRRVYIGTDHDPAGIEAYDRIKTSIEKLGQGHVVERNQPQNKDFDEDLKAAHGMEPIPGREHPTLQHMEKLCARLTKKAAKIPISVDPIQYLQKSSSNLFTSCSRDFFIKQTGWMAAVAYLAATRLQAGDEDGCCNLITRYSLHRDKGGLQRRIQDIKQCVQALSDPIGELELQGKLLDCTLKCLQLNTYVALSRQDMQMSNQMILI